MKITITAKEALESGYWKEVCQVKHFDAFAVDEGRMKLTDTIDFTPTEWERVFGVHIPKAPRGVEKDLFLLADAFYGHIQYCDLCEYGCVGVDCKRPFGNSGVETDVLEIIGAKSDDKDGYSKEQYAYAARLYKEELSRFLEAQWNAFRKQAPQ